MYHFSPLKNSDDGTCS